MRISRGTFLLFYIYNLNENEKEAAKRKDIREIRKWCIEALLEDDTEAQDALRAVAQDKLGMMKRKMMEAPEIGAMLKLLPLHCIIFAFVIIQAIASSNLQKYAMEVQYRLRYVIMTLAHR